MLAPAPTHSPTGTRSAETWVTAGDRPLWAAVHRPQGGHARGVVVVAGPVGLEAVTTHRATLRLATELADHGLVAVRFAWTGDGDSAPMTPDLDPPTAWGEDLAAVLDLASAQAPGAPVHLVGIRLGATVAPQRPVASVTHLEPVAGRAWLRAQKLLRTTGTPVPLVPADEGVEINGAVWTPEQAASISRLRPVAGPEGAAVRVVPLPEEDSETFFSVAPQLAVVPLRPIREIVEALSTGDDVPLADVDPVREARFVVDGVEVVEELTPVAGTDLPAVVTRPAHGGEPSAVVVLTAPGAEPRYAPIHLFSELARTVAAQGAVVVRADRHDLGEAASTERLHALNVYDEGAVDDVVTTTRWAMSLAPGRPVVGVGPCIGSWVFLRAAQQLELDRLVALEAIAWDPDPSAYAFVPGSLEIAYGGRRVAAGMRRPPSLATPTRSQALKRRAFDVAKKVAARGLAAAVRHSPHAAWRVVAARKIVQDPLPLMLSMPDRTRVDVHLGEFGASNFERSRGLQSMRAAQKAGRRITLTRWAEMDHSLFSAAARRVVTQVVLDAVREESQAR